MGFRVTLPAVCQLRLEIIEVLQYSPDCAHQASSVHGSHGSW